MKLTNGTGTPVRILAPVLSNKLMFSLLDDPEIYDGGPVGIQIVARKFEEEKIWAIGKIVHQILKSAGVK
jgi:hypothetical protein